MFLFCRILPNEELNAVSSFLLKFLNCDLDSLPTQALMNFYFINSYRMFKAARNYTRCLRESFKTTFRRCERNLTGFCGSRFGKAPEANQKECFRRLWLNQEVQSPVDKNTNLSFNKHQSCLEQERMLLKAKCQHLLLDVCKNHPIQVIKTVRATMESMEPLLNTFQISGSSTFFVTLARLPCQGSCSMVMSAEFILETTLIR